MSPLSISSSQWLTRKGEAVSLEGSPEYWLRKNFTEILALPEDACDWLIALWQVSQLFDDIVDGAEIDRDDVDQAIWNSLVGLPANSFFQRNAGTLFPLMGLAVLKWKASDTVEREGEACAMSFAWRAGYYDLVLAAVQLTHGTQAAMEIGGAVLKLYGESLEQYMKEMGNA